MSWLEELERLAELKEQGLLTDEEFQARKAAITPSTSQPASTATESAHAVAGSLAVTTSPVSEQPVTAGIQNWWSFGDLSMVGHKLAKVLRRLALSWLVLSWISTIGVLIFTLDDDTSPFVDLLVVALRSKVFLALPITRGSQESPRTGNPDSAFHAQTHKAGREL